MDYRSMDNMNAPPASLANYRMNAALVPAPLSGNNMIASLDINGQFTGAETIEDVEVNNIDEKPSLPRKRKLVSSVWNDFEKSTSLEGKNIATCLHCKRVFDGASCKGTTHLKNHAKRCPQKVHPDIRQKMLTTTQAVNEANAKIANFKFDRDRSRKDLAKLVIKHELPFSFVEYEYFTTFCANLQPQFKSYSRNTIKNDVVKIYEEEKSKLYKLLDKLDSRVGLTTDLWTSGQTMGYACLTAHFIDDEWQLHKKILAFEYVKCPHTAEVLFKVVKSQILHWNLDEKLCAITVDNASNNNAMVRELKSWLCEKNQLICYGRYFHIQCSAHILNLIVQDGLTVISKLTEKIRKSIAYVRNTPKKKETFKTALLHVHLTTTKGLCLDVLTRWNSTYLMLETALELKKGFLRLQDIDHDYIDCPSNDEWEIGARVCQCLKVFYNATLSLSGSKYVTANLYFDDVCTVHMKLREWLNSEFDYVRNMAGAMMLKFMKYWEDCSLIFTMACILDPRWKFDYVIFVYQQMYGESANIHIEKVRLFLCEIYVEYEMKMNTPSCSSQRKIDDASETNMPKSSDNTKEQLKGNFKKFLSERSTMAIQKSELDVYLEEIHSPDESGFNVLIWWKCYGKKFPILSRIAKDIFAIPVTSVASESAFSTGSRVIDDTRTSLLPETVQALICTRDWLPSPKKEDGASSTPI